MKKSDRFVPKLFLIDANLINSKNKLEHTNILEKWHEDGVIDLEISKVAKDEASFGSTKRREKAQKYVCLYACPSTQNEYQLCKRIENILCPSGAKTSSEKNDVKIVFTAKKYCRILITNDGDSKSQPGGILGNAVKLKKDLGIQVLRDYEAVALVEGLIKIRDDRARKIASRTGKPLPEWVGKD